MTTSAASGKRAPPPQLIFDDGSRVMAEEAAEAAAAIPLETPASIRGDVSLDIFYEIYRISEELSRKCTKSDEAESDMMFRVALQFPDELLDDSPEVCWLLEEHLVEKIPTGVTPFVFCLGDTTVGSCCPDEVAALHLQADVMVHYGHACLSPTGTLPVIYSFGRLEMDVSTAVNCICKEQNSLPQKFLVLYEVGYQHAIQNLQTALVGAGTTEVVVGQIPQPTTKTRRNGLARNSCCGSNDSSGADCCGQQKEAGAASAPQTTIENEEESQSKERKPLVVGGLEIPDTIQSWDQITDYTVLFIGESESTSKRHYVNIMLRFLSLTTPPQAYWTYSPKAKSLSTSIPVALQKQLNRRFFLTQKARDANVLGILVSNLSQQHLVDVVKALKARIHDAGKSSYSFAVGKINPAKLANFAEIECFILVACREHSLLNDEREYPTPVITPLELDVALGNLEWGAQAYSLDCQDVLQYVQPVLNKNNTEIENDDDDDAPYFSLVTGKYVQRSSTLAQGDLDLEQLPGKGQVTAYKSEAANFLKHREYQGLSTLAGQTEVKAAVVGQRGIASDYSGS
jgi:diphthamide biosynthesis protein 2